MKPRLRRLGLRAAVLSAISAALFGVSTASAAAPLPLSLLASFDEAIALVSDAAEQRVAELEQRPVEPARSPTVADLLARFERQVGAACDAAHDAVVAALAADRRSPIAEGGDPDGFAGGAGVRARGINRSSNQRATVLSLIDRQLIEARGALAGTTDPDVRAEYEQTCAWLREIRFLI
jgi:hypothetical protein